MTQPDRRHLRRARLALAVMVAAALAAWLWFPGGRTFLQQSLTALASLDPQQVRGFIAAWGPQAALAQISGLDAASDVVAEAVNDYNAEK